MRMKVGSQDFRYGHHGSWWFHQPTLERHLHDGLKRFPNVIPVYGAEVTGISQNAEGATVRYRTVGDATCTAAVQSFAHDVAGVIAETAASRVSERGATRADDRFSEAAMEDRKREGYF